jgi:hypothetical protein
VVFQEVKLGKFLASDVVWRHVESGTLCFSSPALNFFRIVHIPLRLLIGVHSTTAAPDLLPKTRIADLSTTSMLGCFSLLQGASFRELH